MTIEQLARLKAAAVDERRPLGAACRLVGVTERSVVSQILRARDRADRNGKAAQRSRKLQVIVEGGA